MFKMGSWLFHLPLFILCLMGLSVAGESYSIEFLSLCETRDEVLRASTSQPDKPVAVSVSYRDLNGVSSSTLLAETWLKSNVLVHYPAARVATVVVNSGLCAWRRGRELNNFRSVLPSLKNVYHSLKRWGLEKDIKVSVAFNLECLQLIYEDHAKMAKLEPMIEFLRSVNSTYSLFQHYSDYSHSQLESLKNLGLFSYPKNVNVLAVLPKGRKYMARKLSFVSSRSTQEFFFPSEIDESPLHNTFIGSSPSPSPSPSPTPMPSTFLAPESPPPLFVVPASSPNTSTLPPCNSPTGHGSPEAQMAQAQQKLWCVAKPSVPAVKLQQALEYACGEGGADCAEITPAGKCYNPDNVVAHASYAFNSYWQKQKRNGGTCYFGGTAMLIASNPSFLHCQFILN